MFLRMLNAILVSKIDESDNKLVDDIVYGDIKEVEEAIKSHILEHTNFWSSIGYSLLANAAKADVADLLKLILKHANVNDVASHPRLRNLLLLACIKEHVEIVQVLLEFGFDPNKIGKDLYGDKRRCLAYVCKKENSALAAVLLKHGADPNLYRPDECPPLLSASSSFAIVKLLLAHGAKVDLVPLGFCSALCYACYEANSEVAKVLLEYGSDVNIVNSDGDTPLICAVQHSSNEGAVPLIKLLLEHGADPSIVNNKGKTALDYVTKDSDIAKQIADAQLEHILK